MIYQQRYSKMFSPLISNDSDNSDFTSVSSTVETWSQKGPLNETITSRVRIDESTNLYHQTDLSKEDCNQLWYSPKQISQFKINHRAQAQENIKFEIQHKRSKSYCAVLTLFFDACCDPTVGLSSKDMQYFQRWIQVTSSRVGLEPLVVGKIRMDKPSHRQELVDAVIDIQEDPSIIHKETLIAQVAQEISIPSRRFAAQLAHALAHASS
mmetsp:Transcript_4356/g.11969  ORF Transcript_4356/g.11969 Transcript_4356/m.11969 type:complete len:210 (+) Transcript_4356:286-915(+)